MNIFSVRSHKDLNNFDNGTLQRLNFDCSPNLLKSCFRGLGKTFGSLKEKLTKDLYHEEI